MTLALKRMLFLLLVVGLMTATSANLNAQIVQSPSGTVSIRYPTGWTVTKRQAYANGSESVVAMKGSGLYKIEVGVDKVACHNHREMHQEWAQRTIGLLPDAISSLDWKDLNGVVNSSRNGVPTLQSVWMTAQHTDRPQLQYITFCFPSMIVSVEALIPASDVPMLETVLNSISIRTPSDPAQRSSEAGARSVSRSGSGTVGAQQGVGSQGSELVGDWYGERSPYRFRLTFTGDHLVFMVRGGPSDPAKGIACAFGYGARYDIVKRSDGIITIRQREPRGNDGPPEWQDGFYTPSAFCRKHYLSIVAVPPQVFTLEKSVDGSRLVMNGAVEYRRTLANNDRLWDSGQIEAFTNWYRGMGSLTDKVFR